jgi:uncharacterized protein YndB with AHSA1/START domain
MSKPATLEVSMHIAAAPEDVFPYFTDPARHVEWMGSEAELEPVPGGVYGLRMGDGFGVSGTFQEIDPPRRLSVTWGWAPGAARAVLGDNHARDDDLPPGSTRVVLLLEARDGGSLLTLQHHELPTDELREGHRVAWEAYLARLAVRSAGGDPGPDPHSQPGPDPQPGSVGDGARKAES